MSDTENATFLDPDTTASTLADDTTANPVPASEADSTAPALEPFEQLKQDFPEFVIENRVDMAKELMLANGETVQIGPNGRATVPSELVHQIPDIRYFSLKNPSTEIMIAYGVIQRVVPNASSTTESV